MAGGAGSWFGQLSQLERGIARARLTQRHKQKWKLQSCKSFICWQQRPDSLVVKPARRAVTLRQEYLQDLPAKGPQPYGNRKQSAERGGKLHPVRQEDQ